VFAGVGRTAVGIGTARAGDVGADRTGVPRGRGGDTRGRTVLAGLGVRGGGLGIGTSPAGAGGVAGDWSRWTGRSSPQVTAAMTAIAAAAASTRGHVRARVGRAARRPRSTSSASGVMPSAVRR
jgi:hypothetical protein